MAEEEKKFKTPYDAAWKEALDFAPLLFLQRFQPAMVADIDITEEVRSLDEELRQFGVEDEEGVRRVDRLLVFKLESGDWLYVHIEVQCYRDKYLGKRVMSYRQRIRQKHGHPVVTLVVFGDDNPHWCLKGHKEGRYGSYDSCRWLPIKLLHLAQECPDLENEENPFCLFMAAHLAALASRGDMLRRQEAKLRLLSNLQRRSLDEADGREWYRLIDWVLKLPRDLNRKVHEQILSQSTEESMKNFISFAERMGRKEGRKEGHKEGRKEGLEEGELIGRIKAYQKMLKREEVPAEQLEQLELEELTRMAKDLEQLLFPETNGNSAPG